MPTSIDVIKTLTIQGRTVGMDKVEADLKGVATGEAQVSAGNAKLVSSFATVEKSTLSAQRGLDTLTKRFDPLTKAMRDLEMMQRAVGQAQAQGIAITEGNTRAFANAKARVDEIRESVEKHTASTNLNRMQMMEAGHVAKSLFDEMAAGASPMRALSLEGGRIAQIFAEGNGGVTGTLKSLGSAVGETAEKALGFVGPWSLAATAVVGFGTAALLSVEHIRNLRAEMDLATQGAGHFAGLTGEGLNKLAADSSQRTGVSLGDSRDMARTLASSGNYDAGNIAGVMGLTRGAAAAYGLSDAKAGEKLADMFADPLKGIDQLNERLGFVDNATRNTVRSLQDQGDAQGALRVAIEAASGSLNEFVRPQGPLDKFEAFWSKRNAELEATIARMVSGPSPMDQYQAASQAGGRPGMLSILKSQGAYDDGTSNLAEDMRHSAMLAGVSPLMRSPADDIQANRDSLNAGKIIDALMPDAADLRKLADERKALTDAMVDPGGLQKLGYSADQAHQALDRLDAGLSTFRTAAQAAAEQSAFAIAATQSDNLAEKLSIQFQRDYAETLRNSKDAAEAAAVAEGRRNEAIATANKQAEDAADKLRNQDALLGLRPAERLGEERRQALEDAQTSYGGKFTTPSVAPVPSLTPPDSVRSMIDAAAAQTGIDARLIAAVGELENSFRLTGGTKMLGADGRPSTAYGFGQLTDGAAADVAHAIPGFNKYDPNTAVLGAAEYIKILRDRNGGNLTDAMNAYGGTPGYANRIMGLIPGVLSKVPTGPDNSVDPSAYGTAVGSANDHYKAQMAQLERGPLDEASDALKKQAAALDLQRASLGATAGAIGTMNERQTLLNTYQQSGITITDALRAKIEGMAEAYGKQAQAAADFAKSQQQIVSGLDGIRGASKDALGTFVQDIRNGQSAGKALGDVMTGLENKLFSFAEDSIVKSLFGQSGTANGGALGGSLLSSFGGLFGIGGSTAAAVHHAGGIVGAGGAPLRLVDPLMFAGAPRYHSGNGLASDERPAILQTGEAVISRADLAAARAQKSAAQAGAAAQGSGAGSQPFEIHMHNAPAGTTVGDVQMKSGPNGQQMLHVAFRTAALNDIQTNGPMTQALQKRFGTGRVG